ncbi:hypothetical protein B0H11DRAFT_2252070 [Mycena galericulata]|nr:hypothetical protein B0H11DRAFT_2252070 [Mycena galericulata]
MADPQRVRIQPHTRHSREFAHLAPRARLGGNALAAPTPRRRPWQAINSDEALPPCTPLCANAPLASLLVQQATCIYLLPMVAIRAWYERLGEDVVAAPTPEASAQRRGSLDRKLWSRIIRCFASQGASGEPNVVAVRQKLYRVVWLLTRKSSSGTRIQLSMHRGREFACLALRVQLDVVSPRSCWSQPNTARRTLGDEAERSADCVVVQCVRRYAPRLPYGREVGGAMQSLNSTDGDIFGFVLRCPKVYYNHSV